MYHHELERVKVKKIPSQITERGFESDKNSYYSVTTDFLYKEVRF